MSDTADITVALIAASSAVVVAAITAPPAFLAAHRSKHARDDAKKAREDAAVIKDEVKNSHSTNMREEQDDRHEEIVGLLREHGEILELHGKELNKLTQSDQEQNDWIEDINRTWPRSRFMPPAKHRAPDPDPEQGEP